MSPFSIQQIAESTLQTFEDQLMRDHYEAEDCHQCQAYLSLGIKALKWLSKSEEMLLQANADGLYEWDAETSKTIKQLYHRWLIPCETAEAWIARITRKGYAIDNLSEFEQCREQVNEWIANNELWTTSQNALARSLSEEEEK